MTKSQNHFSYLNVHFITDKTWFLSLILFFLHIVTCCSFQPSWWYLLRFSLCIIAAEATLTLPVSLSFILIKATWISSPEDVQHMQTWYKCCIKHLFPNEFHHWKMYVGVRPLICLGEAVIWVRDPKDYQICVSLISSHIIVASVVFIRCLWQNAIWMWLVGAKFFTSFECLD